MGRSDEPEIDRIRGHLRGALAIALRGELAPPNLRRSPASRRARERNLGRLVEYIERGRFPKNHDVPGRIPRFVDAYGTACAVGYLILHDEEHDEREAVHDVVAHENDAYLRDIVSPRVARWAERSGLSLAELARIQPTYGGPSFEHRPDPERPFEQAIDRGDYAAARVFALSLAMKDRKDELLERIDASKGVDAALARGSAECAHGDIGPAAAAIAAANQIYAKRQADIAERINKCILQSIPRNARERDAIVKASEKARLVYARLADGKPFYTQQNERFANVATDLWHSLREIHGELIDRGEALDPPLALPGLDGTPRASAPVPTGVADMIAAGDRIVFASARGDVLLWTPGHPDMQLVAKSRGEDLAGLAVNGDDDVYWATCSRDACRVQYASMSEPATTALVRSSRRRILAFGQTEMGPAVVWDSPTEPPPPPPHAAPSSSPPTLAARTLFTAGVASAAAVAVGAGTWTLSRSLARTRRIVATAITVTIAASATGALAMLPMRPAPIASDSPIASASANPSAAPTSSAPRVSVDPSSRVELLAEHKWPALYRSSTSTTVERIIGGWIWLHPDGQLWMTPAKPDDPPEHRMERQLSRSGGLSSNGHAVFGFETDERGTRVVVVRKDYGTNVPSSNDVGGFTGGGLGVADLIFTERAAGRVWRFVDTETGHKAVLVAAGQRGPSRVVQTVGKDGATTAVWLADEDHTIQAARFP